MPKTKSTWRDLDQSCEKLGRTIVDVTMSNPNCLIYTACAGYCLGAAVYAAIDDRRDTAAVCGLAALIPTAMAVYSYVKHKKRTAERVSLATTSLFHIGENIGEAAAISKMIKTYGEEESEDSEYTYYE